MLDSKSCILEFLNSFYTLVHCYVLHRGPIVRTEAHVVTMVTIKAHIVIFISLDVHSPPYICVMHIPSTAPFLVFLSRLCNITAGRPPHGTYVLINSLTGGWIVMSGVAQRSVVFCFEAGQTSSPTKSTNTPTPPEGGRSSEAVKGDGQVVPRNTILRGNEVDHQR